jgi:hypothetical protein
VKGELCQVRGEDQRPAADFRDILLGVLQSLSAPGHQRDVRAGPGEADDGYPLDYSPTGKKVTYPHDYRR